MKYLVTGATGFIGQNLVKHLLKNKDSVVVLSRDPQKAKETLPGVKAYAWNPSEELAPAQAFEDVDVVIHLAGEPIADKRWSKLQKKKILDSRRIGTKNLVDAINQLHKKPKTLISTSAIGIYDDRHDEKLTEESQTPNTSYLVDVCLHWEHEAKKVDPSVRLCLVRVGIVLGKNGGALKKMLLPFKLGIGGRLGSGKQWMSWIHIDDLIELFLFCSHNEKATGVFNGVSPHPVTNQEFTKALGHVLHRPTLLPVPELALQMTVGELSKILTSSQRCLPHQATHQGFDFKYKDIEPALKDLLS